MSSSTIELLSLAVVREYLSRKGYKSTLATFDDESKKKNSSIQNRRKLAEELKILDLVKENKSSDEQLKCFIEIIVKHLKEERQTQNKERHCDFSGYILKQDESHVILSKEDFKNQPQPAVQHCCSCKCHKNGTVGRRRRQRTSKNPTSPVQKEMTKTLEIKDSSSFEVVRSTSFIEELRKKKECSSFREVKPVTSNQHSEEKLKSTSPTKFASKAKNPMFISQDVFLDDICDDTDEVFRNVIPNKETQLYARVEAVSIETAMELKKVIFGSATRSFNTEWMKQGFYFSEHGMLKYGLVQDKGGPCGLLAAVQAWVLKFLLVDKENGMKNSVPSPTQTEQTSALLDAFSHTLWLVHSKQENVIVTLPSKNAKFVGSAKYKADKLTEKLDLYMFNNKDNLRIFLEKHISLFQGENGYVLFLYSAILSHGIKSLRNSMDDVNNTFLGSHGYCTQEMVNLLLTGKAVSNVFDGQLELGCGEEKTVLHGIEQRSDIGFLSLFEHYKSCEVGHYYKSPRYPIWVVCSESHFSVLFAIRDDILMETDQQLPTEFDLYYFDGLGKQDEEIRLTISCEKKSASNNYSLDLIPPLDHCIRTKWKDVFVSWNDTEPLL